MRLEIENVMGVKSAQVNLEPGTVVEVVGPNAAGKSSVAVSAQAVLAQEINPLGAPAAQRKTVYVKDGADRSSVVLADGDSSVTWIPGAGSITAPAFAPHSRPEAVGLIDYSSRIGVKERAAQMQAVLLPPPEEVVDGMRKALADYLDAEDLNGVLKVIGDRGWEAAAEIYSERARRAKSEWREVAGRNWGMKVAADWIPEGWLADYDNMTVPVADEKVVMARDALNALHHERGVSEAEAQQAENAKSSIPGLEDKLKATRDQLQPLVADESSIPLEAQRLKVGALERELSDAKKVLACPHCGGVVKLIEGALVADEGVSSALITAKLKKEKAHLDKLGETADALHLKIRALGKERDETWATLQQAEAAAKAGGMGLQTESNAVALAEAEAEVEEAKEVVRLVQAYHTATALHRTILRYTECAKAIGPQGIRSQLIARGIARLNAGLSVISEVAGWPEILADTSGHVTWNGRPSVLCSESERWRVQAAMQLSIAAISGSKAVVLDRADLLDANGRTALARAAERVTSKTGIAVLLCSTRSQGQAYQVPPWPIVWIEDGVTHETIKE